MDIFERAEMSHRTIGDCNDIRHALEAEIHAARECARKKVERSTVRWWIGILLPILAGMVFAGVAFAMTTGGRIAKTEASADAREKRLDRIEKTIDKVDDKVDQVLRYAKEAAK